jgi:hypothetical protein
MPHEPTEQQLVDDALEAAAKAETVEAEAGSPYRWKMADAYATLADRGWTQVEIGRRCKTSQANVSFYIAAARSYYLGNNRPTFWQAYAEAKGAKTQSEPDPEPASEAEAHLLKFRRHIDTAYNLNQKAAEHERQARLELGAALEAGATHDDLIAAGIEPEQAQLLYNQQQALAAAA